MVLGRFDKAALRGFLHVVPEVVRQQLRIGDYGQIFRASGPGDHYSITLNIEAVQSGLAEGRRHLLQRRTFYRHATEKVLVGAADLPWNK